MTCDFNCTKNMELLALFISATSSIESIQQRQLFSLPLDQHRLQKSPRERPRVRGRRPGQLQPGRLRDGARAPRHALHHQLLPSLGALRRRLLDLLPRPSGGTSR